MGFSLVAFDTDHIKRYVFATDRLTEIRGASSLLDYLNRVEMPRLAQDCGAQKVYAHGGSGLFLAPSENAERLCAEVQRAYTECTGGGASITAVSWPAPEHVSKIGDDDLAETLALLQWRLQEEKLRAPALLALPSHPFLRVCDACGTGYVDASQPDRYIPRSPDEGKQQYCASCQQKRFRSDRVQRALKAFVDGGDALKDDPLWSTVIAGLRKMGYDLSSHPVRPQDFHVFSNFKGAKDYFALIYADANNMGRALEDCHNLLARKALAEKIDRAISTAVCTAVARHLKVDEHLKKRAQPASGRHEAVFPFDILLMGGDDLCMVTPASVALDVALTLAETFRDETGRDGIDQRRTLSVAVVLAPIAYPFGLLQEMAETALKFAKKAGAEARSRARSSGQSIDDTRINFLIVTGSSSSKFQEIYRAEYCKTDELARQEFHATLRPYTPDDLRFLLQVIRHTDSANLGRTKLHQVRESVLKMNLTTSVSEGMAVLRNWRARQRDHVVRQVYQFAGRYQMPRSNPDDPVSGFPRVTFPWFADGEDARTHYALYRTSLLDFTELYDFVARTGGNEDAGDATK